MIVLILYLTSGL